MSERRVGKSRTGRRPGAGTLIIYAALVLIISGIMLSVVAGAETNVTNRVAAYPSPPAPQPTVELVQAGQAAQVGAPFSLTATATEAGAPRSGVTVTFAVTGANTEAASSATNEAGHAAFTYVGKAAGTDHIIASFVDAGGKTVVSNEVTHTWTTPPQVATVNSVPAPVLGKTVDVQVVSGVVFVKLPSVARPSLAGHSESESLSKGTGFIPLTEARQIPVGSTLDTTGGVAQLTTATTTNAGTQFGDFGAGIFTVLQDRKQRGLTKLNIVNTQSRRRACATIGKRAQAARKHLSATVLGRLNGSAHGKFTTRGQDSAATVRGTIWSVSNRCDGTLTQVERGVVSVRDFLRRKNITLHAGQRYLARGR